MAKNKSETKLMLVQFFKSVSGLLKLFNVILAVISFICVSAVCSAKSNGEFNINFCHQDELQFGYIIWKIFIIIEILLSTCILFFFLFVPALRYNETLNLGMMLYNLIQSIAHIYIWMVGTLEEDPFRALHKISDKEYKDLILVQIAIIVTQANGILYFIGIFVYGDGFTTILQELTVDESKSEMANEQHSSFNIHSQPDSMIVSEDQTVAGSEIETAANSVDASDNQIAT